MLIVMKQTATDDDIAAVIERVESAGARVHVSRGEELTLIGAIGDREHVARIEPDAMRGVDHVVPILKPYKLASAQVTGGRPSVLDIAGRSVGGDHFTLIAGPCTVESRDQVLTAAHAVASAGAAMYRGGAYKPRTSPYSFQGLGQEGLRLLEEAKAQTGLPIVTELMDVRDIEAVAEVADVFQVGARNMQNYTLLSEIGRSGVPVLLKRGLSATLEELLMSAEYVLKEGNPNVMLCERGIRTFEGSYRFTLDITAVPVLDQACGSVGQALDGADVAVVATPLGVLPATLDAVLDAAPAACAVTDVGSAKRVAMRDDERFVGGHPLAGSELGGVEHARA